ncbi:putative membrane protein, partial [Clostridioides difficile CD196]
MHSWLTPLSLFLLKTFLNLFFTIFTYLLYKII